MSSSILTSKRWLASYLIALLLSAGLGWIYGKKIEPETQFWTQVFEKRRVEIATRSSKKILIFTGDSFCSFGIDPSIFTKELGTPSFNLGGTQQMGMRLFMEEALRHAKQGDTIVLLCNPDLLAAGYDTPNPKAGALMALALPEKTSPINALKSSRPGFNHLVTHAAKIALRKPLFTYRIEDYHAGGRVSTSERSHPPGQADSFQGDVQKATKTLAAWSHRCQLAGVKLLYLIPLELTSENTIDANRALKTQFLNDLTASLASDPISILPTPQSGCSSDETLFADTLFHLTEDGAASFTRDLIPVIHRALEK